MPWQIVRAGATAVAFVVATACAADELSAEPLTPRGSYLCTVEQKAGIASETLEGGPPPTAFIDKQIMRFRVSISQRATGDEPRRLQLEQRPLTAEERGTRDAPAELSILNGAYWGDGWKFTAADDQAFWRFEIANIDSGWLWFYHAGFEKPDADHVDLVVRSGTCAPDSL